MSIKWILFILFVLFTWGRMMAQEVFPPLPYALKPRVQAQQTHHRIVIDGRLDEADWQHCTPATRFVISYPDQGKKPSYDTKVMVLYDSVNLYFGAICYYNGHKKSLQVQSMKRDFGYTDNELLNILIQPFQSGSCYPFFQLKIPP